MRSSNHQRRPGQIIALLLMILVIGSTPSPSNQKARQSMPTFSELSQQDRARLDQQRAIIAAAVKQRYGVRALTRSIADLVPLQRLIDDKAFAKTQTYELQSLGVAFGDVLASGLPLRWVMVTDEYGTDPTLRFKQTSLQVNALTMISKRVENGEAVNLDYLLSQTRENLDRWPKS
jgi:hypothetical protein